MFRKNKTITLTLLTVCTVGCAPSDYRVNSSRPNWLQAKDARESKAKLAPDPKILPETHYAAGVLFEAQGLIGKAVMQYRKTVAMNHNHADAYHRLGILFSKIGQHEKSATALRQACKLRPNDAIYCNNLGYELMFNNNWADAEIQLRKAITLQPDFARAHINLGLMLGRTGKFDDALASFKNVLPVADAHYNLGLLLRGQKEYERAATAFLNVLTINPTFTAALHQLDEIQSHLTKPVMLETTESLAQTQIDDFSTNRIADRSPAQTPHQVITPTVITRSESQRSDYVTRSEHQGPNQQPLGPFTDADLAWVRNIANMPSAIVDMMKSVDETHGDNTNEQFLEADEDDTVDPVWYVTRSDDTDMDTAPPINSPMDHMDVVASARDTYAATVIEDEFEEFIEEDEIDDEDFDEFVEVDEFEEFIEEDEDSTDLDRTDHKDTALVTSVIETTTDRTPIVTGETTNDTITHAPRLTSKVIDWRTTMVELEKKLQAVRNQIECLDDVIATDEVIETFVADMQPVELVEPIESFVDMAPPEIDFSPWTDFNSYMNLTDSDPEPCESIAILETIETPLADLLAPLATSDISGDVVGPPAETVTIKRPTEAATVVPDRKKITIKTRTPLERYATTTATKAPVKKTPTTKSPMTTSKLAKRTTPSDTRAIRGECPINKTTKKVNSIAKTPVAPRFIEKLAMAQLRAEVRRHRLESAPRLTARLTNVPNAVILGPPAPTQWQLAQPRRLARTETLTNPFEWDREFGDLEIFLTTTRNETICRIEIEAMQREEMLLAQAAAETDRELGYEPAEMSPLTLSSTVIPEEFEEEVMSSMAVPIEKFSPDPRTYFGSRRSRATSGTSHNHRNGRDELVPPIDR